MLSISFRFFSPAIIPSTKASWLSHDGVLGSRVRVHVSLQVIFLFTGESVSSAYAGMEPGWLRVWELGGSVLNCVLRTLLVRPRDGAVLQKRTTVLSLRGGTVLVSQVTSPGPGPSAQRLKLMAPYLRLQP